MCSGGCLLADFTVGTTEQPTGLPEVVARSLTLTVDDEWVIWAHKLAWLDGGGFRALTGDRYPADARARCRSGQQHDAPQVWCTCGFHAASDPDNPMFRSVTEHSLFGGFGTIGISAVGGGDAGVANRPALLSVVLSGRVLAFEWLDDALLFRAERQTVVQVQYTKPLPMQPPDDPTGVHASVAPRHPTDVGPVRLRLPSSQPETVAVYDDAGYCVFDSARQHLDDDLMPDVAVDAVEYALR